MRTPRRKPKRLTAAQAKPKGLTGRRAASNIFAGLESKRPQQFGKSFAKPVRQPNRPRGR